MKRCAVIGNPIAHSKSPAIHSVFARDAGIDLEYTKECVELGHFEAFVRDFFAAGGMGLNVTLPFKERAFVMADQVTPQAEAAKAANTLYWVDGALCADNTDGLGLVKDITERLGWKLRGKRVLIIGAGGAARGVIAPLLACLPSELAITNRTYSKAEHLAEEFSVKAVALQAIEDAYDVVISASSAGLSGSIELPEGIVSAHTKVYDMIYSADPTPFMQWAKSQGAKELSDGFGMLVGQAAQSFARWFKVDPDLGSAYSELR